MQLHGKLLGDIFFRVAEIFIDKKEMNSDKYIENKRRMKGIICIKTGDLAGLGWTLWDAALEEKKRK